MMRSLFSGVAGLKTHQTRMDVIGNNIANVNTTAYKSQSMTFSDIMYQTTQNASGASERRGGVNARQIGLGVQTSAISTAIEQQGASQTTNNPFDIMISGDAFFVVNNGNEQLYTRDGSFYVDGVGNLAMQSTGYLVQGWASTDGATVDVNSGIGKLQIMSAEHLTYPPAATRQAVMTGNVDALDSNVRSDAGRVTTLEFYDDRGYLYTAKFSVKQVKDGNEVATVTQTDLDNGLKGAKVGDKKYTMTLMDILDNENVSLGTDKMKYVGFGDEETYEAELSGTTEELVKAINKSLTEANSTDPASVTETTLETAFKGNVQDLLSTGGKFKGVGTYFNMSDSVLNSFGKDAEFEYKKDALEDADGNPVPGLVITSKTTKLITFDPDTGALTSPQSIPMQFLKAEAAAASVTGIESFQDVTINTETLTNVNTNKSSTFKMTKGDIEGNNTGRMVGNLNGISVETDGKIWASYSNGQTKLLGQIATAEFANASGLEKGGDNLYRATNNSGEAAVQTIDTDGGRMNTGVLEMSNVDLSSEFTTMITTQRGFQANSRIITVSDTLLEELTNLKR